MNFCDEIKVVHQSALLSQQDFVKALNVSFSIVSRWENGRCLLTYKAMQSIDQFCHDRKIDFDIKKLLNE